jgi:hypothetical protein
MPRDTSNVQLSKAPVRTRPVSDDPDLVPRSGLVPVTALTDRAGSVTWGIQAVPRSDERRRPCRREPAQCPDPQVCKGSEL